MQMNRFNSHRFEVTPLLKNIFKQQQTNEIIQ